MYVTRDDQPAYLRKGTGREATYWQGVHSHQALGIRLENKQQKGYMCQLVSHLLYMFVRCSSPQANTGDLHAGLAHLFEFKVQNSKPKFKIKVQIQLEGNAQLWSRSAMALEKRSSRPSPFSSCSQWPRPYARFIASPPFVRTAHSSSSHAPARASLPNRHMTCRDTGTEHNQDVLSCPATEGHSKSRGIPTMALLPNRHINRPKIGEDFQGTRLY